MNACDFHQNKSSSCTEKRISLWMLGYKPDNSMKAFDSLCF